MKVHLLQILIVLVIIFVFSGFVSSQEDEILLIDGKSYTIEEDEVINSDVKVDGGILNVDGVVNGNIDVWGSSVMVKGDVRGDFVIDSSNLSIEGLVEGDVDGLSSSVVVEDEGVINGDVDMGGSFLVKGKVDGNVRISQGFLSLYGEITGDVTIEMGHIIYKGGHYYGELHKGGDETKEGVDATEVENKRDEEIAGKEFEKGEDGWLEEMWENTYFECLPEWLIWVLAVLIPIITVLLIIFLLLAIDRLTRRTTGRDDI